MTFDVFYDGANNLTYHLLQPNAPLSPIHFLYEDHCGPGQFRRYSTLPERQLSHTYQSFHLPVRIILPCGLS